MLVTVISYFFVNSNLTNLFMLYFLDFFDTHLQNVFRIIVRKVLVKIINFFLHRQKCHSINHNPSIKDKEVEILG